MVTSESRILARKFGRTVQKQNSFENVQAIGAFETDIYDRQRRSAYLHIVQMGVRFFKVRSNILKRSS